MKDRLLVILADAREAAGLKAALERDLGLELVSAPGTMAAARWLQDNPPPRAVLLQWELPGALRLAVTLGEGEERVRVIAFSESWTNDRLRRAAQLGVAAIARGPLSAEAVLAAARGPVELAEVAARLGPLLYRPDPDLWLIEPSDTWRRRMMQLAAKVHEGRRPQPDSRQRALRQQLDATAGGPLGVGTLAALEQALSAEATPEGAAEPELVRRLADRARRFVEITHGPESAEALVHTLLEEAQARAERSGDDLAGLHAAARATLRHGRPGADEPLPRAVAEAFDVAPEVLDLSVGEAERLAGQLLLEEDEGRALEHARYALLAHLLERGQRTVTEADLDALAAVFAPEGGLRVPALVERLAELNPPPYVQAIELGRMGPFARALAAAEDPARSRLRNTVASLLGAAAPLGTLDGLRLEALAEALDRRAPALVGRSTLTALARALGAARRGSRPDAVEHVLFALGAQSGAHAEAIHALVDALLDRRAAFEPARLIVLAGKVLEAARDAVSLRVLLEGELAATAEPSDRELGPPRDFDANRLAGLMAEMGLDPRAVPAGRLPPADVGLAGQSPRDVARLRVLAYKLSQAKDDRERVALLDWHLSSRVDHRVALERMCRMLGDASAVELVRQRAGVGPDTPTEVERLLDEGLLDAAYQRVLNLEGRPAAAEAALLNGVALAFQEVGRLAECPVLYRRALRLQPDAVNLWFNFARIQHARGETEDALRCVREVLRRVPHFTPGRDLFAEIEAGLYT